MNEMIDSVQESLQEKMTPEEKERMRAELTSPDMRPQPFDVSLDGWLLRIELWGKVSYMHIDPENRIKDKVSKNQFMDRMSDQNLLKMFGIWHIEELAINKIKIYRKYVGMDAKEYTEEFIVSIDLRDELKPALKAGGIVGWLRDAFGAVTGI